MKRIIFVLTLTWVLLNVNGQDGKPYDPTANTGQDIKLAVKEAQEDNKHILLMIGGNWCPWCRKLDAFVREEKTIDSLLKADYIMVKVNYSEENKNLSILAKYDYPQRFGFPVLVVLNAEGNRIHTQNTVYLEEDKGYNTERMVNFLKAWRPEALNPDKYK